MRKGQIRGSVCSVLFLLVSSLVTFHSLLPQGFFRLAELGVRMTDEELGMKSPRQWPAVTPAIHIHDEKTSIPKAHRDCSSAGRCRALRWRPRARSAPKEILCLF